MYGIRVVTQDCAKIALQNETGDQTAVHGGESLLEGHRALISDNLTLSLLAWQKHEKLILNAKS